MQDVVKVNNRFEMDKIDDNEILNLSEEMLLSVNELIANNNVYSVPLAELSTLGAGVTSLLPAFRTVTETVSLNTTGLYRLANESVGDVLKVSKSGNFWGAFKTAEGKSKFAQLQTVGPISGTSTTVMPIDPATVMMAVALYSIEQKIQEIEQTQKQILSFLEIEKQSQIKADVEMLTKSIVEYKHNWNNTNTLQSEHTLVLEILRSSIANMNFYKDNIEKEISKKYFLIPKNKVNSTLIDFQKKFTYYRLSLYNYSLASFLKIMLNGNFDEKYIESIKNEIEKYSLEYRSIYTKSSLYLEKITGASFEGNLLKGIGIAEKSVGKIIEKIPIINKGKVDDFLIDNGDVLQNTVSTLEEKVIRNFNELNNPKTGVFIEKMNDMKHIYNNTKQIYFDEKNMYLVC